MVRKRHQPTLYSLNVLYTSAMLMSSQGAFPFIRRRSKGIQNMSVLSMSNGESELDIISIAFIHWHAHPWPRAHPWAPALPSPWRALMNTLSKSVPRTCHATAILSQACGCGQKPFVDSMRLFLFMACKASIRDLTTRKLRVSSSQSYVSLYNFLSSCEIDAGAEQCPTQRLAKPSRLCKRTEVEVEPR